MPAMPGKFVGLEVVLANLNREITSMRSRAPVAMREAVSLVRRISVEKTPKDTGNLRGSCYTKVLNNPSGPVGVVYYTASYAPYVHEIDKNYKVGTWKFLEQAIAQNHALILHTIKKRTQIQTDIEFARGLK